MPAHVWQSQRPKPRETIMASGTHSRIALTGKPAVFTLWLLFLLPGWFTPAAGAGPALQTQSLRVEGSVWQITLPAGMQLDILTTRLDGPRLMTFAEVVSEIAAASARDVRYVTISRDVFKAGLAQAGLPTAQIELLDYLFTTVLDGRNAHTSDGVQRALGRPARDFRDYARDVAASGAWDPAASRG